MHAHDRNIGRDPSRLCDDEVEFLSDQALAALAGSPRLTFEQRAFIGQHVNHPCRVGWTIILGWAREELDDDRFAIVLEASKRPRIAQASASIDGGTDTSRRWKAVHAELDAAAKADGRLARKIQIEAAERLAREYHRGFPTWAGFGIAIALAVLGYFLFEILRQESQLEDCIMQGRHNCATIMLDRAR
jgi:hypothetical protein